MTQSAPRSSRVWRSLLIATLSLATLFFFVAAPVLDAIANRRVGSRPTVISERARELHSRLWVADLHADSLMWNRDPAERQSRGLVDVPRLIDGGVALQAFTVVSKVPWGMNMHSNRGDSDMITLLAIAQRWPPRTWASPLERALYQAERLDAAASASGGSLVVIRSQADLERYVQRRASNPKLTAGYLGLEGAQVLEGELDNLDRLFSAGFRMLAPSHFFDTEMGGSAHGEKKIGLTGLGREVLVRMERLGMIVDLAHASAKTIDDVLSLAKRPVVFSHTGVKGTCNSPRNLSDAQLDRTAARGGLIGIGFFEAATCGDDLASVVRAIRYVVGRVGAHHVALGSDFDGFVTTPIDASELPALTAALLEAGLTEGQIEHIMGGNVRTLLRRLLPPG
jgi:membrane dipeptidase